MNDKQDKILEDTVEYTKGWEIIMHDKCKKNTCEDIEVINMRDGYTKTIEPPQLKECNTFVYAAFLPPGMH